MKYAALKAGEHYRDWRMVVERRDGALHVIENRPLHDLDGKQYVPEKVRRAQPHQHGYKQNEIPVLGFDLHQTLTPDWGFPLTSQPYDGVKAFLDQQLVRGVCLHLSSASLDNPDPDISEARTRLVWGWIYEYGLPICWVGPNSEASLRIDDRGVTVPSLDDKPDWEKAIPAQIQAKLDKTYELDKDGRYCRRKDLVPVGEVIKPKDYPDDEDVPADQPRGLSTPLLDIDFHRTIMPGWGTRRDADPDPAMVDLIRRLYAEGFSIQISCGGWNPMVIENQQFAVERAAWQRRYLRQWGIPYDRLVAKDDTDVWTDDKVVGFKSAKQAEKIIRAKLGPAVPWASNNPINEPDAPIR